MLYCLSRCGIIVIEFSFQLLLFSFEALFLIRPLSLPLTRIRVENMERQLANLTGLVQKALTHGPTHLSVPGAQGYRNGELNM